MVNLNLTACLGDIALRKKTLGRLYNARVLRNVVSNSTRACANQCSRAGPGADGDRLKAAWL